MRTEFLFKPIRGKLMDLNQLRKEMNIVISNRVQDDFSEMDRRMVEVFDQRQHNIKSKPPLQSLGKMNVRTVFQKFK
jgi:hypothetical protein